MRCRTRDCLNETLADGFAQLAPENLRKSHRVNGNTKTVANHVYLT